jgi:hypothetical protein
MPQARRVPMLPPQGWLHHDDDLRVTRDEAWGCFAVFFNGMQVATATEPPPAISPSYLSWVAPARFYGEVQYLGEGEDGPSVIALQVCSYRVIARARQARKRSLAKADWEILQAWVGTLQGMDLEQAGDLIRSLKAKVEPLNLCVQGRLRK